MKKILSLVLAMLMIISMVPAVFAAETSESDYQAAIEYLKAIDLYKGTTDGDAADELVERYQMALFTARMVTGRVDKAYWETDANDSKFTDLEALNAEALGGVCYAAQQGIVNGIGGNEFAPFDNVTYRDAIVMIVRALGFNYPDSGYPWSYVNKARELGVLDGITGVSYTAEVKREVIAQLLYNAINAEIKGETIAASVFGVEETIVMVTASYNLVYGAGASTALKNTMVKVSAIDADGEPIGTEYYVPYNTLGAKNPEQANALVGTYFKLTHKGNFAEFLAVESLTKVFENTPDKKEVNYTYTSGALTLGGESYLAISGDYSNVLNNAQGTVNGAKEVKFFKAFGATGVSTGAADYVLAADGNIYAKNSPFTPYAIYSDLVDAWFKVVTAVISEEIPGVTDDPATEEDETENRFFVTSEVVGYERLTAAEVNALLAKTTSQVMGHKRLQANTSADYTYFTAKYPYNGNPTPYDYYKAIASDIDGDGDYDRVIARPYELLRITKWNENRKIDGSTTSVAFFKATSYSLAENQAGYDSSKILFGDETYTGTSYDTLKNEDVDLYRFTGIKLDKVPNGAFVVAYISRDGVGAEKEIDIVEVIGGEQKDADDNAYVFQTYIRGYDSVTNKVIYGANYDTMYIGTWAVKNTALYDAPGAPASGTTRATYLANTAKYVQKFWNKYVNVYVLNGAIIHIEEVGNSNDFVILESFTDFTEDGLKAMAYSTKDGGYAEVTIGELNGWSLGGYDYELFMLLKQMTDLGLTVKDYPLPIALNKIYSVRSVDENGAYNLVEPAAPTTASVYVNNYGYILGVKSNGTLDAGSRVATSDKDLWIIQTQKCVAEELDATTGKMVPHNSADCKGLTDKCEVVKSNVVMFKGKLSAIELVGFKWYKVANNQYVAVAPVGYNLGPILGNTSEGLDYWMYNQYINNYKNETLFNGFYYGHYMTNVRTGAVEFVTYDSKLASDLFANNPTLSTNYIVLAEGAIYPAINKVLKTTAQATMADVAALQYASAKYHAFDKAAVGAVIPADYTDYATLNVDVTYTGYENLRDEIALNLYAAVYGNDFTNDPTGTDVYNNIIKKELLANVTFINRTAAGTYESWVGYKSSNDTWPAPASALGSETAAVYAYVLYDYANGSAKVFIDSMAPVTLVATSTGAATVTGVDATATVTYNYNGLQNKTNVAVTFSKSLNVTAYDLGTTAATDVDVNNFGIDYVVEGNFSNATISVTAVADALAGLTKIDAANITALKAENAGSVANLAKLVDGQHHTGANVGDGDATLNFVNFANNAYNANLEQVGGQCKPGAMYYGYWVVELTNAEVIKGFRLSANDYSVSNNKYDFCLQGLSILVSTDGTNWTNVGNYYNLVDGQVYVDVEDATRDYYAASGALRNDTAVKYVALAVPGAWVSYANRASNPKNGLSKYGSGTYVHLLELELYK